MIHSLGIKTLSHMPQMSPDFPGLVWTLGSLAKNGEHKRLQYTESFTLHIQERENEEGSACCYSKRVRIIGHYAASKMLGNTGNVYS